MRDFATLKERYMRDSVPVRLGNLASNLAHISSFTRAARQSEAVHRPIDESRFFIEWTAGQMEVEKAAQLVDVQINLCRWYWSWPKVAEDRAETTRLSVLAREWSNEVLELSGLLDDDNTVDIASGESAPR